MNVRDVLDEARDSLDYCRELKERMRIYRDMSENAARRDYDLHAVELCDKQKELETELAEMLRRADRAEEMIDRLKNAKQKAVMKLVYLCGHTIRVAAKQMQITERWAGQLIRDGVETLERMETA